ncbi:NHERF family PDZ scaffold protein 4b isoform X2 [Gouania willdenowi]|uniref:Na(+)/H(+) exchange regulatory cofactor NHE-RF3-like n=1 Tax=Gouania willdenowi TaxID=441366 RepID=A0A8C5EYS0_GOUWI|nr:Na(+)/H(+) exchange regulatory cofactor NHE-RF4-like isoform X2 [Gouania willdenowi]
MPSNTGVAEANGLQKKFTFNPKEGIINPVMVISEDPVMASSLRLCVLKREEKQSYGFKLHEEVGQQGHIIRNLASGGIAQKSGLQDGDRLLEVNKYHVNNISHSEVARLINLSGNQLCLLVLDVSAYDMAVSQGQDLCSLTTSWGKGCTAPRLCHITRDSSSGLGLNFTALQGEKGRFSANVVPGGAADKAGVCKGDHLVWMNGATVADLSHAALCTMMKKCSDLTILVIESESEQNYIEKKMPILPSMAVPHNLPHRSRKLHLLSAPDGYGFLLRLERTLAGRELHYLRAVEKDSSAEKAGMRNGELLLEVNGELAEHLTHHEIVNRVRTSGERVSLTTISLQGLDFYIKLGLSPLLFCEDTAEKENVASESAAEQSLAKGKDGSLEKGSLGFGFDLGSEPQTSGTFIHKVVTVSSAEKAGLSVSDVVMEVNEQNVEKDHLEDVLKVMKETASSLSLLAVDGTEDDKKENVHNSTPSSTPDPEDEEITAL